MTTDSSPTDSASSAAIVPFRIAVPQDDLDDLMTVPLALSQFRDDHKAIRRFAERDHANIVAWKTHDLAGHYAAHQAPLVLATDIRDFFGPRSAGD